MTVYEMIQELAQCDPDSIVHIQLEGPCTITEYKTEKSLIGAIDKDTVAIGGVYMRNGVPYFDVSAE